jgi:tetratricopeptide (TPR) repeat protein
LRLTYRLKFPNNTLQIYNDIFSLGKLLAIGDLRALMTRGLAHKKISEGKSGKITHPAAKQRPKRSEQHRKKSTPKSKPPVSKVMRNEKLEVHEKTSPNVHHHPVHKESTVMEAESRKPAFRTGVTSAPLDASPRLLRHTKTTSAALEILGKGIELIYKREFKKARNELKMLVENYPSEIEILARARSYIQICEREEASQKKPTVTADQLYALGVMEHNKANYDSAISYFRQSLENHPDADYIYYSVAASQAKKGELAESMENLRKAIALNEDSRIYAKNDDDFAALLSRKEFAELVGINAESQ